VRDSEIATFALLQMLTAVTRWYRPQGRLTLDQMVGIYTDLSFGMLRANDGASARQIASISTPSNRSRRHLRDLVQFRRPLYRPRAARGDPSRSCRPKTNSAVQARECKLVPFLVPSSRRSSTKNSFSGKVWIGGPR
jgi:tetracycline repressor-like protein